MLGRMCKFSTANTRENDQQFVNGERGSKGKVIHDPSTFVGNGMYCVYKVLRDTAETINVCLEYERLNSNSFPCLVYYKLYV